jgi:arginine decarboxylase
MNYSQREYARNIVRTLQEVCGDAEQPVPDIISESGRALTAHHAVLITSVIDKESAPEGEPLPPADTEPVILHELHDLIEEVATRGPLECLHDAASFLGEAQLQYTHGVLSLTQRAYAERTYFAVCRAVAPKLDASIRAHREALEELERLLRVKQAA